MCDCLPSALLPYSGIRSRKEGFTRCNRRIRTVPVLGIVTRCCPGLPNLHDSDTSSFQNFRLRLISGSFTSNRAAEHTAKFTNSVKVSRNSSAMGSGEYEFYNESGFKEKEKRKIEFERGRNDEEIEISNKEKEIDNLNGTKMDGPSSNGSAKQSVDFLEFNKKSAIKSNGSVIDEDLVNIEAPDDVGSTLEELERPKGGPVSMSGRQLMKRSNMFAKQVISVKSALSLGFVSQLWVDTNSWVVLVVEVRPNLLSGELERFLLEDVSQVGDVVLIQDESVGYNVVTPGRQNIGKVRGYTFNINSGAVESLELDSFGISIIPSSLVSTYALFVEDVLEVVSDTVVVHEAAASHIQRLTKGFWGAQNVGNSIDMLGEYPDLERPPIQSDYGRSGRRSFTSQKFQSKTRQNTDDWELPMDYL
ncbi:hypothetical protein F0562_015106 [Nyssa sinensis]|uniref:PRC-barrel domain-containing protein n=1 Tax=Nyssa sinensis TaxID=561372 RepID=A0A5J4ZJF9_9ASTE|nr:hypothetical protein F0562_015106 [Nyssa sinensis]